MNAGSNEQNRHEKVYRRAFIWLLCFAVTVSVILSIILALDQRQVKLDKVSDYSDREMVMAREFIRDAFLRQDYQAVEVFLKRWFDESSDILELKATAENGFVIAHNTRHFMAERPFLEKQMVISHAGEELATLYSRKDLSAELSEINNLFWEILAATVGLALILLFIIWKVIKIFLIRPLERAERDLVHKSIEAEKANNAKSSFLLTMSHEIRTPLNGVIGMAQLLSHTELDKDQKEKVSVIIDSGEALLSIISHVLDMSKIESGKIELEQEAFDIRELIQSVTDIFKHIADDSGLAFVVDIDLAGPSVIEGDPVRVRQILLNLLSNAFKFTPSGTIRLKVMEAPPSSLLVDRGQRYLQIMIEDSGKGIARNRLPHIFEEFTQEDSQITRRYGGTGLGLAIVKGLIDLMGGSISADSTPGEGSRFTLLLPAREATAAQTQKLRQAARPPRLEQMPALRILVAEDNRVNALIARAFLEKLGHNVTHVENGRLAVKAVAEDGGFDLVFMDVHMPEMDGIEATVKIRELPGCEGLPIIGLTAEAFVERHQEFRRAGMADVLTKPFTEEQLIRTILENATPVKQDRPASPDTGSPTRTTAADPAAPDPVDAILLQDDYYPVISDERLDAVRNSLRPEEFDDILGIAEQGIPAMKNKLLEAIERGDLETIKKTAHAIKGAAGSLYAIRLSKIAALIEQHSDDRELVLNLSPKIDLATAATLAWIQETRGKPQQVQ